MTEQEELNQVNLKIKRLKDRKRELEDSIASKADFLTKFRIWWDNDDECLSDWMPTNNPILRRAFDDQIDEPRRGKTYDICDIIGDDEFEVIIDPDFNYLSTDEIKEIRDKWMPLRED